MNKKAVTIMLGLCGVLLLTGFLYVFSGTKNAQTRMWEYLHDKGYTAADIQSIDVHHSFLNVLLSYSEWSIHVRYADEPDAIYSYTVKNGQITAAGVSGAVQKEELKHKE